MPYGHTTPRQCPLNVDAKMDAAVTPVSGCLNAVCLVRTGTNGVTQQFPVFRHIVSGDISHDVPLAFLVVWGKSFVSSASDLLVWVPVEIVQSFSHSVLQMSWGTITKIMESLVPHICVFVVAHFKHSVPELWQIVLYSTWTHLTQGLLSHDWALVFGQGNNSVNVTCVSA